MSTTTQIQAPALQTSMGKGETQDKQDKAGDIRTTNIVAAKGTPKKFSNINRKDWRMFSKVHWDLKEWIR